MRNSTLAGLLAASLLSVSACDTTQLAYGDANSIIVVASPEMWETVQDSVYSALEPYITTTVEREEIFQITYQDPSRPEWANLRRFRQLLVFGTREDPVVTEALANGRPGEGAPEGVTQVFNAWATGQVVTVVTLPDGDGAEAALATLPGLREMYLRQYREWAVSRMFVSGRDTALADTLTATAGFSLLLPHVYDWDHRDSVYIFRNDNPDPSELIRQVMVTWRTSGPESLDRDALVEWRNAVAAASYSEPQVLDFSHSRQGAFDHRGLPAYRIQAMWQNPPEESWPAAGPVIIQTVECAAQDRLYLLDAWLYAPGKDKFEYMTQLETILGSFRCGEG